MDLESLIMHSISQLPSRMHGCGLCREAEQGPPSLELMLPLSIPGQRTALPWEYLSKSQICVRDKTELHFKQWIWGGAQDLKFGLESCGLIIP